MKRNVRHITVEELNDFSFTKEQESAYEALKKACARCKKSGLRLLVKTDNVHGYPAYMFDNELIAPLHWEWRNVDQENAVPHLWGATVNDSGADDTEHFRKDVII